MADFLQKSKKICQWGKENGFTKNFCLKKVTKSCFPKDYFPFEKLLDKNFFLLDRK